MLEARADHYIAPSWSWAAVAQPVLAGMYINSGSPLVKILNAEVHSGSSQGRFGSVKSGFLRMQGPLVKATWVQKNYFRKGKRGGDLYPRHGSDTEKYQIDTCSDALEVGLWDANRDRVDVSLLVLMGDEKLKKRRVLF